MRGQEIGYGVSSIKREAERASRSRSWADQVGTPQPKDVCQGTMADRQSPKGVDFDQ